MTAPSDRGGIDPDDISDWELTYRAVRTPRYAAVVAGVVVLVHVVIGVLLRSSDTGVDFRLSDQVGLALIGVVIGGVILLLTRPRIRVGPHGVAVRNLIGERFFGWADVNGIWYPDKGHWARLELPGDDYVPVMAIQANDGLAAVGAMDSFRELHARHSQDPAEPA
ncbi:PH domain-containing protein [Williamsia sp. CHRR-6]|uniref:PH domain-containing protein n=1 Tax=Williamsia sp. CHRR-6 TaxID=2835871 RepID=UPI001BDA2E85|nr:PH domain-containing protein [Williamsia sp. CHRR-6]MBT0568029.1 PH domain-containing protein [Williamsia sp. CHRR-6]